MSEDVKFGTSGLRGLVTAMTPELVSAYVRAFLASCETGTALCVGRDLRPSSPRIAENVIATARAAGRDVIDCGALPTPALALAASAAGAAAIMITGSHIPADRNGLKFYTPTGEITKSGETAILDALTADARDSTAPQGALRNDPEAGTRFVRRYTDAYGAAALSNWRIGLYAHSSVGSDLMATLLTGLGAEVVELGRSAHFIPMDTEAVDSPTRAQIVKWVVAKKLDALVSMDGDADRPLLADAAGEIVPGDIMGQITAEALGATTVVTPISSNSGVTLKNFDQVIRTRIGSPFVIAGMDSAAGAVVGYEANGGFLLGFTAEGPCGALAPLRTRDCALPLIATLHASRQDGVAARVAKEPPVVAIADRLQHVPQAVGARFVTELAESPEARAAFLSLLDVHEKALDLTDGLRIGLADGAVLHIRPSGNAPELRIYVEAPTPDASQELMRRALEAVRSAVTAQ